MKNSVLASLIFAAACWVTATLALGRAPVASAPQHHYSDRDAVSLMLVDSDIHDALRLIAAQVGANIVVSNQVSGRVTLDLQNTSLRETLDAVTRVGGHEYTMEGNLIIVHTSDEVTSRHRRGLGPEPVGDEPPAQPIVAEVIRLRYLDAELLEPLLLPLLSEAGSVTLLKTADHLSAERGASEDDRGSGGPALQIGSRLETSSHGQPARSHTLMVQDHADRVRRIQALAADLDRKPEQVVIEARFVEIALDDDEALGLDWNVLARVSGGAAPHTAPFFGDSLGTFDPGVVDGVPGSVFPSAPNLVANGTDAGLFTFGTLDFTSFTALLEMIQRQSRVQMVSNPRVVVGDRHTATILVGERYPILSANVSEFGTVTEQLDRYEPIGVQLAVTPSVVGEDEVQLIVRPSTSSLGAIVEGSTGLSVARINSRQIDTSVTVRDGQTVVLGGLITTRDVETDSRVPFLGSIPLLGKLFSHSSNRSERVDLVVFLTVNLSKEQGLTRAQRELFEATNLEKQQTGGTGARSSLQFTPSPPQY